MEALFAYLICHDRFSPGLLLRAAGALAPRELRSSTLRKRLRRTPAPSPDLARSALACVRGGQSDEDLWVTWRWAVRDAGASLWLMGVSERPELNDALASWSNLTPMPPVSVSSSAPARRFFYRAEISCGPRRTPRTSMSSLSCSRKL